MKKHVLTRLWRREEGFTLLEMLIVLTIIGLLASLVAPRLFQQVGRAKEAAVKQQMANIALALEQYQLDNGEYPTTEQGLAALRTAPTIPPLATNWQGPYLAKNVPKDPWNHDYVYKSPGANNPGGFDLMSLGKDGQPGGDGENKDISY
ncbi:MAG: type II secretion system major pseudopilin GspG [Firmicutes bacterium]|nr:type II secretion system major pseudopilin GspG [Bacillota bacterium]